MKIEVMFVGESLDTDTYESDNIQWGIEDRYLNIYTGTGTGKRIASYPADKVVRVRVIG